MAHIDNHSPFPAELFSFPDLQGQEVLVLVVSVTFDASHGELTPADKQSPIQVADRHFGKPELTSVRREAEVAVEKPFVDVIVNGSAHAPNDRPKERVVVELQVADIHKRLSVTGDRYRGPLGIVTPPEHFVTMPIVYERAYGGTSAEGDKSYACFRSNPVGVGFRNLRSRLPDVATDLPNIENLGRDQETVAGFGAVSRGWSPRLEYAGTYDREWKENQWPLLPHDFDVRHYQAAPADQQSVQIVGGEPVRLVNLTPEGVWDFFLPQVHLPAKLIFDNHAEEALPRLDTIVIEPDERRVYVSLRLKIPVQRNLHLREVSVGDVPNGYVLARVKRKIFLDFGRSHRARVSR